MRLSRGDVVVGGALTLLCAALYAGSAPAVVNLDGLGYIKLLPHNFAAGHLLYMPLLRAVTALCRGDGLLAGRLVSAAAATVAVALFFRAARALVDRFGATFAAAGLAVSYATWIQGADVEAYSCALAALTALLVLALAYRDRPSPARAFTVGLALAGAVLFHLTHVFITPFVFVFIVAHTPDRRRGVLHGCLAAATGGALTIGGYAWAALHVRHLDLAGAARWVATAGHGFVYEGTFLQRLGDAVYGLAKAFVWSPYLYESNAQRLVAQLVLGIIPLVALGAIIVAGRRTIAASLPWRSLSVWMAGYVLIALAFFGSDHERWLFVLPPLWLLAAAALAPLPPSRRAFQGGALVTYLLVANAATAIGPEHNNAWERIQADAAAAPMRDGDLVLFPGHSWDEYVGFYTHVRVIPFPLAYYAGRDGKQAMLERLEREVKAARGRGARVFSVRVLDERDVDSRGFYELQTLGLPRPSLVALLDRFIAVPIPTVEPKVTVWRLDDRP